MSWCYIYYITSVILYIYICSGYVTASEYYISADPNGVDCPSKATDLPCHNLSYYAAYYASYFTDDTIFHFLNGSHTLQGLLVISDVSNITLQGLGYIKQGFHETVMQSTSVIMCSDYNNSGIEFANSTNIILKSLTIANCGVYTFISSQIHPRNANVSLFFADTNNVKLERVSVQNGSEYGLCLVNSYDVLIVNSTFANNGGPKTIGGNALIVYDDQRKGQFSINIVNSNFTLAFVACIHLWYFNEAHVIIDNCKFSHNIVGKGGGVYIQSHGNGNIKFRSCTIHNNIAQHNGGGAYIDLYEGGASIEFNNCTICNNTAQQDGGGMEIEFYKGGGSIEFNNCTIYNNSAQYSGGGVYIDVYQGGGSIEFSNCTICNNTAQYDGGGVDVDLFEGGGSIEFNTCNIYNNTAHYDGGGVHIDFYDEGGSIEFCNCTINNNTAYLGSGVLLRSLQVTSKTRFYFKNVFLQFNKAINKLSVYRQVYQSAMVLLNIDDITFDYIEVKNHNITGLVCLNSQLTFNRYSSFVNNFGIDGGGIALYESS